MKLILISFSLIFLDICSGAVWADEPSQKNAIYPEALYRRSMAPTLAQIILSRSTGRPYTPPQEDTHREPQPKPQVIIPSKPKIVITPSEPKMLPSVSMRAPGGLNPDILARIQKYDGLVRHYSRLNAIDSNLTRAVIYVESAGDPQAVSMKGAAGLMQLMPTTAKDMGVRNLYDPAQNIFGGTRYLSRLLERFGRLDLALWGYNAGPEAVKRKRLPLDTRRYIPSVIRVKRLLDDGGA